MRLARNVLAVLFTLFLLSTLSVKGVDASTYSLSGSVTDNLSNPINGATVEVFNFGTSTEVVPEVASDTNGNYAVNVPEGTYDIKVTPPTGSSFSPAAALSQNISANRLLNFVLVPIGSVTLSGHIYDALNTPVPNASFAVKQNVGSAPVATANTDASGSYTIQVSPGTYVFEISGNYNTPNLPSWGLNVGVFASPYSLTQSTVLDITIPVKQVSVRVQDPSGNPVSGVKLTTSGSTTGGLSIGGDITNAGGGSGYDGVNAPLTDGSGNAVLWLLPASYAITVTPPSGSDYLVSSTSVSVTGDTSTTVILEQSVTLSGHIYDALNTPVPNASFAVKQNVGSAPVATANTDASGSYTIQVSPGTYVFEISGNYNTPNLPSWGLNVGVFASPYSLTQSTVLDITIPVKQVSVRVQDPSGNPVSGVKLTTSGSTTGGLSIGGDITNAGGGSGYDGVNAPLTDGSGNAVLWLLPASYAITVTPPSGSDYLQFTLNNISVTGDQAEVISLQFVNQAPILTQIGNRAINEGAQLQFTINATDPDGDNLTYSASNLPPGATFTQTTRTFSWTPGFDQEGNYDNIEFTVTDNGSPMGLDTELITITVGGVNRAPVFGAIGSQEVLENTPLTFTLTATDPDGDGVTLSSTNLPTGASFNSQTGVFSWTPTLAQSGSYVVTFSATDDGSPSETGTIDVAITVGDDPTPTEQAENLVDAVIGYNFSTNIENSYLANLKKVAKYIEDGKIQPAINQLNAFITKVEQDYTAGTISQAVRDNLVRLTQALLADLQ